jgi:type III secretory pathway component EscS
VVSLIQPLSSLQRKTLEYCFRIIQTKEKKRI